jgi:hypothetical protein
MDYRRYLGFLSVFVFSLLGLYTLLSGIKALVLNAVFPGVMGVIVGLMFGAFAVILFFFFYKKVNPYVLIFGAGGLGAFLLIMDIVYIFVFAATTASGVVAVIICLAFCLYGVMLYRQMVAEGRIVRKAPLPAEAPLTPEEGLKKLAALRDKGLITESEYNQKRQEYLGRL